MLVTVIVLEICEHGTSVKLDPGVAGFAETPAGAESAATEIVITPSKTRPWSSTAARLRDLHRSWQTSTLDRRPSWIRVVKPLWTPDNRIRSTKRDALIGLE